MSESVKQILNRFQSDAYMGRQGKVYTDTSDFMRITGRDVIILGDGHYLVLRDEVERSYGGSVSNKIVHSGKNCTIWVVQ